MRWTTLAAWLLAVLFVSPAVAEKRVALVVGNSAYQNVSRLENPKSDALLVADTLKRLDFTLVGGQAQVELDKAGFDSVIQRFGSQLMGADVALFYYAGHGIQVRGTNYLVPLFREFHAREADVDFQMVDVNLVLRQMEGAGTRLNIVIWTHAGITRSADAGFAPPTVALPKSAHRKARCCLTPLSRERRAGWQ